MPGNDKERYERQLEVLEMEQETLKGTLLQASIPAAVTFFVFLIAGRRRRRAAQRLEELRMAEQLKETNEEQRERWARTDEYGRPIEGATELAGAPNAPDAA